MLKVIPLHEATKMVVFAQQQVKEVPTYRLGQALYNMLPKSLDHDLVLAEKDHYRWYNSLDNEYCVRYFYEVFVVTN